MSFDSKNMVFVQKISLNDRKSRRCNDLKQFLKSMFSLDLRNESFEINCKDPDDCVEFTLDTYKNLKKTHPDLTKLGRKWNDGNFEGYLDSESFKLWYKM